MAQRPLFQILFLLPAFFLTGCSSEQGASDSPFMRSGYFGKTDTPNTAAEQLLVQGVRYVYEGEENDHFVRYEFMMMNGNVSLDKTCTLKETEAWPIQTRRVSGSTAAVVTRDVIMIKEGFKSTGTVTSAKRTVTCEVSIGPNSNIGYDVVGGQLAIYLSNGFVQVLNPVGVLFNSQDFRGHWKQYDGQDVIATLDLNDVNFVLRTPCGAGSDGKIKWNTISGEVSDVMVTSPVSWTSVIQPSVTFVSDCEEGSQVQIQPTQLMLKIGREKKPDGTIEKILLVQSDLISGFFNR